MKQPSSLCKEAALVSAILLIGGFVAYRAGAFDSMLFSSSKSTFMFVPHKVQPPPQPSDAQAEPIIMGGSKSLSVGPLIPPPAGKPADPPLPGNSQ